MRVIPSACLQNKIWRNGSKFELENSNPVGEINPPVFSCPYWKKQTEWRTALNHSTTKWKARPLARVCVITLLLWRVQRKHCPPRIAFPLTYKEGKETSFLISSNSTNWCSNYSIKCMHPLVTLMNHFMCKVLVEICESQGNFICTACFIHQVIQFALQDNKINRLQTVLRVLEGWYGTSISQMYLAQSHRVICRGAAGFWSQFSGWLVAIARILELK